MIYINGQTLKKTYDKLLHRWEDIIVNRPGKIIVGERSKELEELTNLDSLMIPSMEEQIEIYISRLY